MNGLTRHRRGRRRNEWDTFMSECLSDLWRDWENVWAEKNDISCNTGSRFGYPKINLRQDEKEYVVEAGVPGLTKEDVKVDYADGLLTISGKKQNSSEIKEDDYYVRELHKSSFSRSVKVDEDHCDVEHIEAGVQDGILIVKIPKKVLDKPPEKRIIKVE